MDTLELMHKKKRKAPKCKWKVTTKGGVTKSRHRSKRAALAKRSKKRHQRVVKC
jgi:hypothetical protein